jgi:hypothetical protein
LWVSVSANLQAQVAATYRDGEVDFFRSPLLNAPERNLFVPWTGIVERWLAVTQCVSTQAALHTFAADFVGPSEEIDRTSQAQVPPF